MSPKLASSSAAETLVAEPTAIQLHEQYPHASVQQIEWLTRRFYGNTRKIINMLALGATRPSVLMLPHQHVAHDRPQGGPSSVEAFFGEVREDNAPSVTNGGPRRRSLAIESMCERLGDRMKLLGVSSERLFTFACDPELELSNNS